MSTQGTPEKSVVKVVEAHVERLISEHKHLSERNRELTAQCDKLRSSRRELQERVAEAERLLAMSELTSTLTTAGGTASSASRQRARSYINRLMREIDACITYMTSSPSGAASGAASGAPSEENGGVVTEKQEE